MKRILSFVLALCLIVGLLPAVAVPAFADVTTKYLGVLVGTDYMVELPATNDGATKTYTKNKEVTMTDSSGATFTGFIQEIVEVTNEETDEWNMKFFYDTSAKRYKLIMKGARIDAYNNETGKPISGSKAFGIPKSGYSKYSFYFYTEIHEDSYIEANYGWHNNIGGSYKYDQIFVESKNDATLHMKTSSYGFYSQKSITLNANIKANSSGNSFIFMNAGSVKITVNGGHLQFDNVYRAFNCSSSVTTDELIINGGKITGKFTNACAISQMAITPSDTLCYKIATSTGSVLSLNQMAAAKDVVFESSAEHMDITSKETVTQAPTCGTEGSKNVTVYCNACAKTISDGPVVIPATGKHEYDKATGYCVCGAYEEPDAPIEPPAWPEDMTFATAEQMANVVLEKKGSAGGAVTAHPGGKITFKLLITNNNAETINVYVTDMIPRFTKLLSGCDYTSGRALYWVVEDIAPGETRVITYTVSPKYTVKEVRASEKDIILAGTDATVMDVTIPATEDIWVLETFNAEDIRKLEMAIDALVTAYQPKLNEIKLLNMIFNVGFTAGPGLGTTDPNAVLEMIFDKAGENVGGSTGSGEDAVDTALNLLDRVPPHLYGGTAVPAEKDELFRGARATEVTIADLISGDLLFVKNNGETKLYIVDNSHLVYLGKNEVIRKIDPANVLPGLPASEQFVVVRPSINYNITFGLQEGEYYNDADKNGYTEVEKAIIATAEAYLLRGDRAQYTDDMTGTSLYRWETGTKQPEYYTVDQYGYTNCAAFTYDANYMTTGFAAKNGNNTLNTTANNAAFAKANWNFETGTSSNPGVVYYAEPMQKDESGTYVCTLTEEEKAAMKAEIISLLRPGDIINIRRTTGSGHAMLYVGNGTIIHSGGGSYSNTNKSDTHEATVRFRMVEDLFDPAIYAETSCVYYLASFALVRPSAMTTKGATEHALNRMNNMRGIIGEKVTSTAMGKTVNCGDEITYTFYVFNTNNEDKAITITDELSEHVTFVSATDNAVVDGSNISWNVTVPADTRISVSYTVKVKEGLAQYTAIDGSKAKINGAYHKCYDTYVANTLTATEQQTVVDAVNKVKDMDLSGLTNVQIAELIYKEAFGIEHIFGGKVTTGRELVGGDTDNDYSTKGVDNMGVYNDTWYWESSNKTSVSWMPNHNTSAAAQMVAPGLYGGQLVYQSSYNKNNRDERQNRYLNMVDGTLRSRYFWEKDLVVGDIFMMGGSTSVYLFVYVGDNTFVNIAASGFTDYTVTARFEYAPASTWKYLAVLRPSFVFEEAHNIVEIPATGNCIDGGTTAGKECADCGVHLVEPLDVPAGEHTEEIIPGKAATCTEPGLTDGKKCTVCGEITVAQTEIPATGHINTTTTETVVDATCTAAGSKTTTVICSCGYVVSTETEEIAMLGHTEEIIPGRAPTCTSNGRTEGKKCSVCGEILVTQEVIPAISHEFDENGNCVCGASQPAVTVVDENFQVEMNSFEYVKGYIFYIEKENAEGVDLTNWSAVMTASKVVTGSPFHETDNWKSFSKLINLSEYKLPNVTGTYVLFVEYLNNNGATKRVSASIDIVKKPKVTCGKDMFAIDMDGLTYKKGYIFYLENAEGADMSSWDALYAAAKVVPGSAFNATD
ncbi:MAG: DUF11 domain-containing protein, partial [Oscillospiraceae bacterium]|nr:DUF11 domain-containing protein [Oscillospiraceae bacterium]